MARRHGIAGAGDRRGQPASRTTPEVLEQIAGDPFLPRPRGQAGESAQPDFVEEPRRLPADPKLVGIRGFLWAPTLTLDATQIAARQGAGQARADPGHHQPAARSTPRTRSSSWRRRCPTCASSSTTWPAPRARGPAPEWAAAVKRLAAHKNIYIKFSSFFDMCNPAASEDNPWKAPTDLAAYKPHFDVLCKAFGPDRLIYGSNYPVVTLGGGPWPSTTPSPRRTWPRGQRRARQGDVPERDLLLPAPPPASLSRPPRRSPSREPPLRP